MKTKGKADTAAMIGTLFAILVAKNVLSKAEGETLKAVLDYGTAAELLAWATDMKIRPPHERMLNLEARVQNNESVIVMMATTVQSAAYNPDVKTMVDEYMEAWYQAQIRRGAAHLKSDNGEVFI